MKTTSILPALTCATQPEWEAWLAGQPDDSPGVWLRLAKKGTGIASISYEQALESALCYGWIDGQRARENESYWRQRFTPRRPRSVWSRVNCEKVTALMAAGRMQPTGLRQVEQARADGRWAAAYAPQSAIEVPADLQAALDAAPAAGAFFATLDRQNRYAVLYRIQTAKKAETRAARIERFVAMLAQRQTIYPIRQP